MNTCWTYGVVSARACARKSQVKQPRAEWPKSQKRTDGPNAAEALRGKRKHSPSITRKRGNTEAKTRRTHDSMTVRCKEPSPSASADTAKSTEERQETERCVQQCMLVGVRKQHRTRRPGTHRQERCDVESLARVPEPTWHGTEANRPSTCNRRLLMLT